ncbi:MAG: hemolysin family protein [Planctomycetota bacterium]
MIPHLQLVLLAVLLACSAMISCAETALFALSRQNLRAFERSENRFKRMAAHLRHQPRTVLMTVLITNTTVNVCFFTISVLLFKQIGGTHPLAAGLGGLLAPFVLIFCGEIFPKAAGLAYSPYLAPVAAPVVEGLALALTPLRVVLERAVVTPLTRIILPSKGVPPQVTTHELRALVELSARQGVINVHENDLLQQIVALPDTSVRSVMVPRVDMVAVPVTADRDTVSRRFRESGRKKLPVYGRNLDNILGLIHAVDLHINMDPNRDREGAAPNRPLRELLKPVYFVPEQANLLQLLQDFRRSGTQLAIVVDEYGGTAGLVSLEDVLEHLVGDLADADEKPSAPTVERVDEKTYRLSGDFAVRALADYFGIRPGTEGVETLGGFMLSQLGRLPQPGDVVRTANLKLTVERVTSRRVDSVRVELVDPASRSTEEGPVT